MDDRTLRVCIYNWLDLKVCGVSVLAVVRVNMAHIGSSLIFLYGFEGLQCLRPLVDALFLAIDQTN